MGKVRNETIKKFGRSMVEKFPDKFNQDFADNKKVLEELAEINSKKLKNRIAGYITSLMTRSPEIIHEPSKEEEIAEKAEKEEPETKMKKQEKVEETKAEKKIQKGTKEEPETKMKKQKKVEETKEKLESIEDNKKKITEKEKKKRK